METLQGWGQHRATTAWRELLSARGWGVPVPTCTSLITNTAPHCSNTAYKASRWKKCPTTLCNTAVTLLSSGAPKQSCPSNQKTTSNPPNSCCSSSALNKAIASTCVQHSGLFLLQSGQTSRPSSGTHPLSVPRDRKRWHRAGAGPVGSTGVTLPTCGCWSPTRHLGGYLLTGGGHLKTPLAEVSGDASYPKCLPTGLRKSLLQGQGRKRINTRQS